MHVGTFTPEGTWAAAAAQLAELARIGITDRRDDADRRVSRPLRLGLRRRRSLRAARTSTARPTICARFVDRAHALGLGVILDVVYNHLGPDGNYLAEFSPDYFTDKYTNDWGRAINFEGPAPARAYLRPERALLDRRVSFRRPAARRDAGHQGRVARHVIAEIIRPPRATRPAACRSTSSPRTSRRTRSLVRAAGVGRLRRRRAVERRCAPYGGGRADRPARGVLSRLPGHARRS